MNRSIFALACLLTALTVATSRTVAADSEPWRGRVIADGAAVRSGPGEKFYATDELNIGDEVEVYLERNQQWCAIRPPEGSFSWVQASHVEETAQHGLVRVTASDAYTRVGSTFGSDHHVKYVRLKPGEVLQTIGPVRSLSGSDVQWYRIMPPSGEFRWIERKLIEPVPDATNPSTTDEAATVVNHQLAVYEESAQTANQVAAAGFIETYPIPDDPAKADHETPAAARSQPAQPAAQATGWHAADRSTTDGSADASSDWPVATGPVEPNLPPAPTELDQLNLQLSQTVAQPIQLWQLDPIRQRTEYLLTRVGSPVEQEKARQLLRRLGEFEHLQLRHRQLGTNVPPLAPVAPTATAARPTLPPNANVRRPPMQTDSPLSSLAKSARDWASSALGIGGSGGQQAPQNGPAASNYNGSGWLIPVVTSRADVPRYALTDNNGTILQFVSPAPGLNLNRYVRQRVGVYGPATPATPSTKPEITAQRIVLLDRHSTGTTRR